MTRFLKFLAAILLAFLLINMLYLFLLPRIDWEFKKTKEAHLFKGQQFKVLVFGNSTAMDGINTALLSKHFGAAYNFSVGGASLESNYTQFKEYLQKNSKPDRVLLFLSSAHIHYSKERDMHPVIEYYYGNSFGFRGIRDIPLFKFRWLFIENFKKLLSADHRSAQLVNGQLQINRLLKDNTSKKNDVDSCLGNDFYLNPGYEYLWKIIEVCKKENIAIEIFEMPCWKGVQNECPDIVINKKMGTSAFSAPMYNLNNINKCDTMLDPKTDWLSKDHLNYNGSIKVTGEIIRLLSARTPLTTINN